MAEDLKAVMAKIAKDKAEREAAQKAEDEADKAEMTEHEVKRYAYYNRPKSEYWIETLRTEQVELQKRIDELSTETGENKELLAQAEQILLNEQLGWNEGAELRRQIIWTKQALEKLDGLKAELAEVDVAIKMKEEAERAKKGEPPSFEETVRRHKMAEASSDSDYRQAA
jgi:hypothetical protein